MENPTRAASARAIFCDALLALRPPRSMKYRAAPRLAKMARKAMITRVVMDRIIG